MTIIIFIIVLSVIIFVHELLTGTDTKLWSIQSNLIEYIKLLQFCRTNIHKKLRY